MENYLKFEDITPLNRKTQIVKISGVVNDTHLGEIRFYGAWRQYTFWPKECTIFDTKCLNEIVAKIDEMNAEIRKEWAERRL